MRKHVVVALIAALASGVAFAQVAPPRKVGGDGNPYYQNQQAQKVQIQGNTDIKATQENGTAVAVGEGNSAKNTAGAIKGGTQIQGNTRIQASQKNSTAVAVGKGNTAANEAGVIGGK